MIPVIHITNVLGGAEVLNGPIVNLRELAQEVERGLPKRTVHEVGRHLFADDKDITHGFVYRLVPEASYKRRKERLTPEESARVERIARVVATVEFIWDDPIDSREFLMNPNPALEGRTPLDVAMSEIGARRVEALLWDIFYGHPA